MVNPNKTLQTPSSVPSLKSFRGSRSEPATTRLYRLLLILFTLTALLGAYFSYRPVHKARSTDKWWIFGTGSSSVQRPSCDDSIEGKINDLAKAFGIPPRELASAIAVAVKNYAPPESTISSLTSGNTFSKAVPSLSTYDGFYDLVDKDNGA